MGQEETPAHVVAACGSRAEVEQARDIIQAGVYLYVHVVDGSFWYAPVPAGAMSAPRETIWFVGLHTV